MSRSSCSWGAPRPPIDPATFGLPPKKTALRQWMALYCKEEEEHLKNNRFPLSAAIDAAIARDGMHEEIIEACAWKRRYFLNNESSRIIEALMAQPGYLRTPLLQRLNTLQKKQDDAIKAGKPGRPASRFIHSKLTLLLRRIALIDNRFLTKPYQIFALREHIDDLPLLPHLNKRRIQTLATLTAGAFSGEFDRQYTRPGIEQTPAQALAIYQRLGHMALSLHITPPRWEALRLDKNRRNPIDMDKLPGAIARLMCADYWKSQLWRLRCRWREEQLRAAGQVSRQVSPYLSRDALSAFREQRRRMREFLKSHELVSEDGFTIDLEDVYYASASSPKHRRFEMMTTMKGIEMIAEERGDVPTFITVTCPSRFHAITENGHPNPKWDGSTIRDSSDYLVGHFFAAVRKKLKHHGLFWYGIRVAEPHHDGTVHWHMMMFTRPDDRETIEGIVRDIAIRDDRPELGDDITPRFKSEVITTEKGSPTGYIATYIGKNIDRGAVKGNDPKTGKPRDDNESGKPMAETVENAIGWAGLHGVRQFQFFGIPSRQVWRELRRLACQMTRQKNGPQRLPNQAMDNVLACADAGDFAAYIMAQGGVLIPRKNYVVRTAYDIADRENAYGENPIQIYGIYSPILGDASRICTHPDTWTLVKKAAPTTSPAAQPGESVDVPGGPAAPWTCGNNCPGEQKTNNKSPKITQPAHQTDTAEAYRHPKTGRYVERERMERLKNELSSMRFEVSESMMHLLMQGARIQDGAGRVVTCDPRSDHLISRRTGASSARALAETNRLMSRLQAAARRKNRTNQT
ncbi:replication endonuclease [Edwardsiella tarda]|uniref:replication endonuclease n=1 Tax=Edwardsiella tarda TaxID=636 RepID=UPI002444AC57|nr:replication endonuclease [Edwardsiella tarda]WGE29431.1 replication endonuclease [Edwardsiella tarda]